MNPKVDAYLQKADRWLVEIKLLRRIILECGLTEELKWGKPFYTFQHGNVVVIWGFKDHCALGFCKGALLKDSKCLLLKPGENTQAVRKIRFTGAREILEQEATLKAYIHEAIEVEKAGLEVSYQKPSDFTIPEELMSKLETSPNLKAAFQALTPGRQRGYLLFFSAPKQPKTRASRIEKCVPRILSGKGLDDR